MPKQTDIQANFTAGELDPKLAEREDLEKYFAGAEVMKNVDVLAQGGFECSQGTEYIETLHTPGLLDWDNQTVDQTELVILGVKQNSYDPGGTDAALIKTLDAAATTPPVVLVSLDFSPTLDIDRIVAKITVRNIGFLDGTGTTPIVQWAYKFSSSGAVTYWGDQFELSRTTNEDWTTQDSPVAARIWELHLVSVASGSPQVEIASIELYRGILPGRIITLFPESGMEVAFVFNGLYYRYYENGERFGGGTSVRRLPFNDVDIRDVRVAKRLDTIIFFHPDQEPYKIVWSAAGLSRDQVNFDNVPQYSFGDSTGGVATVMEIEFISTWNSNDFFKLILEGEETKTLKYTSTDADMATAIQDAINDLPNVDGGVTCTHDTGAIFNVVFGGAAGARPWQEMQAVVTNSGGNPMSVRITTEGQLPEEDCMSDDRGWPSCGAFVGDRLIMGGLKSLPDSIVASVVGEYYNLDNRTTIDSRGFLVSITDESVNQIGLIYNGDRPMIIADGASYFMTEVDVTPNTVSLRKITGRGVKATAGMESFDDAVVFIDAGGGALREMVFNPDGGGKFDSRVLSYLGAHLVVDPSGMSAQLAADPSKIERLFLANALQADHMTVVHSLRGEEIIGFSRRTTLYGRFEAVAAMPSGDVWLITQRSLTSTGAQEYQFLEKMTPDAVTDCAVIMRDYQTKHVARAGQAVFNVDHSGFEDVAAGERAALTRVRVNGVQIATSAFTVDPSEAKVTLDQAARERDVVEICTRIDTLTGAGHLNGAEGVYVYADSGWSSPAGTIANGEISIPDLEFCNVQAGFWEPFRVLTMPYKNRRASETLSDKKKRVVQAKVTVEDTNSLALGGNGRAAINLRPSAWPGFPALGNSPLNGVTAGALYSGKVERVGMGGWTYEGQVELTQIAPGRCRVTGLVYDVVWS